MQNDIVRQPQPPVAEVPQNSVDAVRSQPGEEPRPASVQIDTPGGNSDSDAQAAKETSHQEQANAAEPATVKHKSTKPIGVIVAAVLICTGLTGGAIYGGLQNSGKGGNQVATQNGAGQSTAAPADDTASEVDAAINDTNSLQDTAQDLSTDMSDASLGL